MHKNGKVPTTFHGCEAILLHIMQIMCSLGFENVEILTETW